MPLCSSSKWASLPWDSTNSAAIDHLDPEKAQELGWRIQTQTLQSHWSTLWLQWLHEVQHVFVQKKQRAAWAKGLVENECFNEKDKGEIWGQTHKGIHRGDAKDRLEVDECRCKRRWWTNLEEGWWQLLCEVWTLEEGSSAQILWQEQRCIRCNYQGSKDCQESERAEQRKRWGYIEEVEIQAWNWSFWASIPTGQVPSWWS